MKKYFQSDELQKSIDFENLLEMPRYAGGHDDQMQGLFKDIEIIAHYNEGDYQGMVATCVKFKKGKFKKHIAIYNDYYGSCSGCDAWEDATDEEVRKMCIGLANSAYIFKNIEDVKEFLLNTNDEYYWNSWNYCAKNLLSEIEKVLV